MCTLFKHLIKNSFVDWNDRVVFRENLIIKLFFKFSVTLFQIILFIPISFWTKIKDKFSSTSEKPTKAFKWFQAFLQLEKHCIFSRIDFKLS